MILLIYRIVPSSLYSIFISTVCPHFQVSNYVASQQCKARNLIVGKTYQFRVMAENKYGVSDPAITVDPITARHPFGIFSFFKKYFYPYE